MIKNSQRFSLKRHLVNDYYIKFFLKKERLDEFIFNFPFHAIVIVNIFFQNQAPNDPDLGNKRFYCVY